MSARNGNQVANYSATARALIRHRNGWRSSCGQPRMSRSIRSNRDQLWLRETDLRS